MTPAPFWRDKVAANIDALCAPFTAGASPGAVVAVVLDGDPVYQRGFGLADIEKGIPLGPGSVFDVGSLAKQFTALCIALLEEDGVLDLDEDVRRHVPEMPVYDAPVTIRHLIHHTSGLRDYIELLALGGIRYSNLSSPAEALSLITRQRGLNHPPGAEHIYNNSGYVLLSLIAERAAGAPLGELAHRLIFAPLGMHDTRFRDGSAADLRNLALGYVPADGGFRTSMGDTNLVGDGALLTTASDLILWVRSFEENRLGKGQAELIRRVLTPGTLLDGRPIDYAFGHYIGQYRDQALVHHGGTWAGYRSEILHFPGLRLSVICLSNLGSVSAAELSRRIADVYLAELLPAPAAEPESAQTPSAEAPQEVLLPAEALAARTGTFRNMSTGRIWEIGIRDGRLFASSGPLSFSFLALGEDHFRAVGAPLAIDLFCTDHQRGKVIRWRLEPAGQEPAVLAAMVPALPEDLSDVAGVYHSDELGVTHEIAAVDGGLLLRMNGLPYQVPLTPVADDQLTVQGVMVRLLRGDDSRVRGFTVSSGRVRHLAFSKQGSAEPLFREGGLG